MQYELILTGKFKKSLKLAKKRGWDLKLLIKLLLCCRMIFLSKRNIVTMN